MYPLERFLIASRLEEGDHVQAAPFITGHFILWFAGIPEERAVEYWGRNYKKKLYAQLKTIKAFESFPDVLIWPGVWADFGLAVETSALGCNIIFSDKTSPFPEPVVKDLEAIDRLRVPDPKKDGLMPLALEAYSYMVNKVPPELRERYGYGQWTFALGPSDIAGLCMGYDRFLVGLYRYADSIQRIMKIAAKTTILWIEAQRDAIGSDLLTFISGDTDCFLNPKQFETFSYPYISRVCSRLERKGKVVLYHNDGNTTHLLDRLANIGANMFNYGQGMSNIIVKKKVGRKMGLVGGLNSIGVMLRGAAKEVEEESKKAILECGSKGGFVLSNEGGTAAHTPWENIVAMMESATKYGKYLMQ